MPPKFPNLAKLKARTKSGGEEAKKQVTISKFFLPSKTKKQSEESKETTFVVGDESPTPSDKTSGGKTSSVLVSSPFRKRPRDTSPLKEQNEKKCDKKARLDKEEVAPSTSVTQNQNTETQVNTNVATSTLDKLSNFNLAESTQKDCSSISVEDLKRNSKAVYLDDLELDTSPSRQKDRDEEQDGDKEKDSESKNDWFTKIKQKQGTPKTGGVNSRTKSKYTPLEQQFMAIKEEHPDAVLLVECGYKYRFFGDDAEIAAKVLNIYCHMDHNFMTASIPVHRLYVHVRRIVAKGYKVGVVKQTETAALKAAGDNRGAPFTRQLSALYTKSTLIGEDVDPSSDSGGAGDTGSGMGSSSFLMCVFESQPASKGKLTDIGVVAVQPSTGAIVWDTFEDGDSRGGLETRMTHISPAEILLPETLSDKTDRMIKGFVALSEVGDDCIRLERIQDKKFDYNEAFTALSKFYGEKRDIDKNVHSNGLQDKLTDILSLPKAAIQCLYVLLEYLRDFHLDRIMKLTSNVEKFSLRSHCMQLSGRTIQNLELFNNLTDNSTRASLMWVLDHTFTKYGARKLRRWLAQPLTDINEIRARQDAVADIMASGCPSLEMIRVLLGKLPDLEKGLSTIYHKKCSPQVFLSVVNSLEQVQCELLKYQKAIQSHCNSTLILNIAERVPTLLEGISDFVRALNEGSAKDGDKTNLFTDLKNFPKVQARKNDIEDVLAEIQGHRREVRLTLRQPALDFITVSGAEFLIEVKNKDIKVVPDSWTKISSTKQVSRFHSPFIVEAYKRLCQSREQLVLECNEAWQDFLEEFSDFYPQYHKAIELLATYDCLLSLAGVAQLDGYCKPEMVEGAPQLNVTQGRHPVINMLLDDQHQYVPNDTNLEVEGKRCMVLTGPNMGGKSSYIKQVALIAIMAQIGSYVPAEAACLTPLDAVYTRMGASDELYKGRSTFMVELQEASDIMSQVTENSLVILDELGRGTSTHDGVAIACAALNYFVKEVKCLTLFVTHYPPVTEMEQLHPEHIANYHMGFLLHDQDEDGNKDAEGAGDDDDDVEADVITFLYQAVPGVAARSYGLNVARLAGVPDHIIKVGAKKSKKLELEVSKGRQLKSCTLMAMAATEENVKGMISSMPTI